MPGNDAQPAGYRMEDIVIDAGTRQVRRGDVLLPFPALSFDLLLALVRRAPNVVTADELMRDVWEGRVVNDETVAKRVELVREALGDDSRQARYIAVVRGRGYRIAAQVEPTSSAPEARKAPRIRPAAILTVVAMLAIGAWVFWPRHAAAPAATSTASVASRPVLAVLPLANLSPDNADEYFAAGMHEALIADLSKASGIKVISRTSTLPYRDSGKSLSAIARELGVDLVMEGSVLRADDRVRITLQLLDAGDTHLWADHYEGNLRDVLALQSRVARSVAQAVKVQLSPGEDARLSGGKPVNVESYELYLQGGQLIESDEPGKFDAGIAMLTRATELDPTSALAYTRLAIAYATRGHEPGAAKSMYPRATAYALQAVGLDENLADAHVLLGALRLYFHWDWQGAAKSLNRGIELSPSSARGHAHFGWLRVLHDDYAGAIEHLRLASELEPGSDVYRAWLAWVRMLHGDFAGAEKELQAVLRAHPQSPVTLHVLGQTYLRLGRVDDAIAAFRRAGESSARWSWGLGQGLAAAGRKDEARALAAELAKNAYPDAWALAEIYCATDDLDEAADWIARGYEARRDWMPWIRANTFFAPLRDHPRFREVVRKLDLPVS